MTIANVMSGALGYAFQVLMGRMLSAQDFALFASIMSVVAVAASPGSAFFTVVSRNISQAFVMYSGTFVRKTYNRFGLIIINCSIILIIISCVFGAELSYFIRNSTAGQIALLAVAISVTTMGLLNNAYLQGGQRYFWLACSGFGTATLKIIISVVLVLLSFGVYGALIGSIGSVFIANIIIMLLIRASYKSDGLDEDIQFIEKRIFDFKRLVPILVANVSLSVMIQLDVMLVNNFFDVNEAGKFAAAATLGKAILYLPGGIVLALFPMVAEAQAKGGKVANYIITASLLTVVMCLVGISIYWMIGNGLVDFLFGEKYHGAADILKYYSLAMLPMALLVVTEYFLMALGKVVYAWLFLIFAPIQVLLISNFHQSVFDVIAIMGICSGLLLFCGYFFLFKILINKKV